jgi:asparagine synthase (glutamine-hydrolysing)
MLVDLQTGTLKTWQYYTLSYTTELGEYDQHKAEAYASDIRDLLFDAVRLRLRADVPVGTCLSGGLDSSAIVAIMGKLLGMKTTAEVHNTFTATFPGEAIDESRFARTVVNLTGAKSHFVNPSKEDYWNDLPAILYHQDEPFGSTTVYSQWEVMQEAAKHVKVVLDGQGGDEVFGGYWHNRVSLLAHLLRRGRLCSLATEIWGTMKHAGSARRAFAALQPLPFYVLPSTWKSLFYCMSHRQEFDTAHQVFGLEHPDAPEHIKRKFSAHLNEMLFYYLTAYSLPYLLKAEDRNSMAHSIEARVPFTDYRLVDYVFALPAIYKVRYGWTKWLLRLAVKDLLPPEIIWRKDKLGFATPSWASRHEEWKAWIGLTFHEHSTTSTNL